MKIIRINKFESFEELYQRYQQKKYTEDLKSMILLFVASDDPQLKESWCSDCRNCKPIVDATIENFKFNDQIALAIVEVGQREQWKQEDNLFRTHELKIQAVPTLYSLNSGLRLVESECADAAKVSHLFSNSM